jgi:hypothetical protein
MLRADFLRELKRATEAKWREKSIDPTPYGFQFQRGTRWNEGLSYGQERVLRVRFPHDCRAFLHEMNGTNLATLNVLVCSSHLSRSIVLSIVNATDAIVYSRSGKVKARHALAHRTQQI